MPQVEQLQARMVGGSCIKVVVAYQQAFWLAQRERDGARDPHVTLLGPAHNVFHSSAGGLPALVCLITGSHAAGSSASGGFDGDDSANPLGGEKSSGGHELPPGGSGHAGACVAGARRCLRDRVLQQVLSLPEIQDLGRSCFCRAFAVRVAQGLGAWPLLTSYDAGALHVLQRPSPPARDVP